MMKISNVILLVFIGFGLFAGCQRSVEVIKFSDHIELFGFGGQVDQRTL